MLGVVLAGAESLVQADSQPSTERQLDELRRQNVLLQEQLQRQQGLIEALDRKVNHLEQAENETTPKTEMSAARDPNLGESVASAASLGHVQLSGEGGVAFFNSGSQGMFPHSEFRIDEARLFVEGSLGDDVYAYTELNVATREEPDVQGRLGEAYLDFENVSRLWHADRLLNLRLGRMYIPFGEEYQERYAIDNPLISHSLADIWGVDEGVELYGRIGQFSYVAAVQNGGISDTRDFDGDKSVAGRVGWDPARWLHLSVSGMRTGDLDVQNDGMSALWFGNGFVRSLGSPQTTKFHANLVEGDAQVQWRHGHVKADGGYIRYGDNDPAASNGRDIVYYSVEAVQDLTSKLYGGLRFSQIIAPDGFPLVGNGDFADYFFNTLTKELWRLSVGVGYRWNANLLLKAEYSFERGKELDGEAREHEDLFAMEAAFKF